MKRLKFFLIALLITFGTVEAQRSINDLPQTSSYQSALRVPTMEDSSGVLVWRYSPWSALTNALNDSVYSWFNTGTNFNITQTGYNKLVLSLADNTVTGSHIINKSIYGSNDITDGSITGLQLANQTIPSTKLQGGVYGYTFVSNSIGGMALGQIPAEGLADNSVTSEKIANATIAMVDIKAEFLSTLGRVQSSNVWTSTNSYSDVSQNYYYGVNNFMTGGQTNIATDHTIDFNTGAKLYMPLLSAPPTNFRQLGIVSVTYGEAPGDYRLVFNKGATAGIDTLATQQDLRNVGGGGTGSSTLLGLTDIIPSTYNGAKGRPLIVDATQTGMTFGDYPVRDIFDLTDFTADTSYENKAGYGIIVNTGETGLQLTDLNIPRYITSLGDVPSSYSGYAGYTLGVNSSESALEFIPAGSPVGGGDEDTVQILIDSTAVQNDLIRSTNSKLDQLVNKNDTMYVQQEAGEVLEVTTESANARTLYTATISSAADSSEAIKIGHKRILAIGLYTSGTLQNSSYNIKISVDGTNYDLYKDPSDNSNITFDVGTKNVIYWITADKYAPLNDFKLIGVTGNETSTVTVKVWAGGGF